MPEVVIGIERHKWIKQTKTYALLKEEKNRSFLFAVDVNQIRWHLPLPGAAAAWVKGLHSKPRQDGLHCTLSSCMETHHFIVYWGELFTWQIGVSLLDII